MTTQKTHREVHEDTRSKAEDISRLLTHIKRMERAAKELHHPSLATQYILELPDAAKHLIEDAEGQLFNDLQNAYAELETLCK